MNNVSQGLVKAVGPKRTARVQSASSAPASSAACSPTMRRAKPYVPNTVSMLASMPGARRASSEWPNNLRLSARR